MKAIVCSNYGGPEVLRLLEVAKPTCGKNELLIQVMATAVNSADVKVRALAIPGYLTPLMRIVLGIFRPRRPILGTVYAGVVEAVGTQVRQFKQGDRVFGSTGFDFGAYATYLTATENSPVSRMPEKASFAEAAALVFGGQTAHWFLQQAGLPTAKKPKLLLIGSTGAVGTAAVQLAHAYGADITAVCSSAGKDLMEGLGVSNTLFYDTVDYTKCGGSYDVVFDAVGVVKKSDIRHLLREKGRFISVGSLSYATETKAQLAAIKALYESAKMRAVIDRTYSLEEIVEAHRYVDTGRKKGNVVIQVASSVSETGG
ncbi:NAD(P)-dependent alcohol dehydrogenase [Cyclobacterium xiamenense]|uniref:NAD(P)-dependent alcohol dehydrogenase n=1 Tax=Cyclobacterium xiamenense TaxID=1297121 RepID=UPI0012BA0DB8|nr:NAD(P)-dependent alcohol dehydrogenase [Cyclobacterium xiamenense]